MKQKHKKECQYPLEQKEIKVIYFRCKKCGYTKRVRAVRDWYIDN